ncbi:hypothetical protein MPSEU_000105800 [Mayamaea pseudoterrestris]|nr:hypothetical protein MPSEU_000105800 [Mayamaea pseudoterrestris]
MDSLRNENKAANGMDDDEPMQMNSKTVTELTTCSSSDVLTLNIGGSCTTQVLRSTLTFVETSLLARRFSGRWDSNLARDAHGNYFVDEDPAIFVPLLNHLRDISKQTPIAFDLEPPTFTDLHLEKRFRLAVDHYGLTDAFYPVALFTKSTPPTVASRDVLHWEWEPNASIHYREYFVDLLQRQAVREGLHAAANACASFERNFKAFEVAISDPTVGHAHIGWMQRDSSGHTGLIYLITRHLESDVYSPPPYISYYEAFNRAGQREYFSIPSVTWTAHEEVTIQCCKSPKEHLLWSVNNRVVAKAFNSLALEDDVISDPSVVLFHWTPPTPDMAELVPFVSIDSECRLRFTVMELGF